MIIKKKAWPELFQKVLEGQKKFDIRLADVSYRPGDILLLEEWDPQAKKYTGRTIEKKIIYVLKTKELKFWPKEDIEKYGLQVLSLE